MNYSCFSEMIHGGNIQHAIETYGIAREHWLDLSTGISPYMYPIGQYQDILSTNHRLIEPHEIDRLRLAACRFWHVEDRSVSCLAVSGL